LAYVADLPYETPSCTDLSYKTGLGTPAADGAAQTPPAPSKSWWMFWK